MSYQVLLVNSVKPTMRGLFPDNGLARLASHFQSEARIFDTAITSNVGYQGSWTDLIVQNVSREVERGYDHILFKVFMNQCGDTIDAMRILREKYKKDITIGAGGPHVTYFDDIFEELVLDETLDFIVQKEGIALDLGNIQNSPNVIYKDGSGRIIRNDVSFVLSLDYPFPDYTPKTYPAMRSDEKMKHIIPFQFSDGCNYGKCNFCFQAVAGEYRERSVDAVVDELNKLKAQGAKYLLGAGGAVEPEHANAIASRLNEIGLYMPRMIFINMREYAKYDFEANRKSGVETVFIGPESGNLGELQSLNKDMNPEMIAAAAASLKNAGINVMASFIYLGDIDEGKRTVDFIDKISPDGVSWLSLCVMPKTELSKNKSLQERLKIKLHSDYYLRLFELGNIDLTRPMSEWPTLPYTMRGKGDAQLRSEVESLVKDVESLGVNTRVSGETFGVSSVMGKSIEYVRDVFEQAFRDENIERVKEGVRRANKLE